MVSRDSVIGILLTLFLLPLGGSAVFAQQNQAVPGVFIDTSVLESLDPHKESQASAPARNGFRPSLTAPAEKFPIEMKVRSEVTDPSLSKTPITALPTAEAPPVPKLPVKKVYAQPLIKAPVAAKPVKQAAVARKNQSATPPLPGKKPSAEQVAQWIAAQNIQKKNVGPKVKAMPPTPVTAEMLAPPPPPPGRGRLATVENIEQAQTLTLTPSKKEQEANDPLMRQLATPDFGKLASLVESLSNKIENRSKNRRDPARPLLEPPAPKIVTIHAQPLEKNIVAPIERIRPVETAHATAALDLTAIEPAAGKQEILRDSRANPVLKPPALRKDALYVPRPPQDVQKDMDYVSLPFVQGVDTLDGVSAKALEKDILPFLKQNPRLRLQIQAFADGDGSDPAFPRRLSLARALAVRAWLIERGIEPRRLDVRAMGSESDRAPLDRVDMVFIDAQNS